MESKIIGYICGTETHTWILFILYVADKLLEYWLGRTDKVKAGSTLELILNGLRTLIKRRE